MWFTIVNPSSQWNPAEASAFMQEATHDFVLAFASLSGYFVSRREEEREPLWSNPKTTWTQVIRAGDAALRNQSQNYGSKTNAGISTGICTWRNLLPHFGNRWRWNTVWDRNCGRFNRAHTLPRFAGFHFVRPVDFLAIPTTPILLGG